jgi:dienelactone hydrolase
MRQMALAALVVLSTGSIAMAEIKTETVTYTHNGTSLKGFLAWDDAISGKRPGVLVVHEWWGLNDYARKRAEMLAQLGYVAFACDMYGEGKVAAHPQEAGKFATEVRSNVKTWQGRAQAALKVLQENDKVDPKRLAAIGYCFGGSTALQLAFTGADIKATVSFHGALTPPTEEQAKAIKAKILVCHGALDSFIPEKVCQDFRAALEKGNVDYQFIYYAGARHGFTVAGAEKKMEGLAHNANADRRSWEEMKRLFNEVFGK